MEQVELLRTLRVARAAATAYEVILEYLEDAGERIMDLNPLKLKQKKLNLLIDDDDDEDESLGVIDSLKVKGYSCIINYIDLPVHLAINIYRYGVGTSYGLVELGVAKTAQLYNEGRKIPIINTALTKATDLTNVILKMLGIVESSKAATVNSKTMTVTISTHDDTLVIEDIHHSETSSDEGSSSSDENEDDN